MALSYTDSTITFDKDTRFVDTPKRVFDCLNAMGFTYQTTIQSRRMFDEVCNLVAKVHVSYDDNGVTFNGYGTFTYLVKNPKFVCERLKKMGVERMAPIRAKHYFDLGCVFYDSNDKMALVFTTGQLVRHKVRDSIWEGIYKDGILSNGQTFSSLSKFVSAHYCAAHPTRKNGNAWAECETFDRGQWVSIRFFYYGVRTE